MAVHRPEPEALRRAAALAPLLGGLPTSWRSGWEPSLLARSAGAIAAIALYACAALLALRAARNESRARSGPAPDASPAPSAQDLVRAPSASAPRSERLWLAIALGLALLAVARVFDLGNLATSLGRIAALRQGWYWHRRPIQFAALCALVIGAGVVVRRLRRWSAAEPRMLRLALGGTVLLFAFAVLRALSWHYLDRVLGRQWLGVRLSWLLELSGALAVALAAALARR